MWKKANEQNIKNYCAAKGTRFLFSVHTDHVKEEFRFKSSKYNFYFKSYTFQKDYFADQILSETSKARLA